MNNRLSAFISKKAVNAIEWKLLIFLVLFMDVKLVVKLAAIVLIFILQPDFKFGFNIKNSRLPVFYLLMPATAVLNWLLYQNFSLDYSLVLLTGVLFWVASILAIQQVKLFVEKTPVETLHDTLVLFFIINIAFSLLNLAAIFWEIGLQNPFRYQGEYQKYFINTGDHIKGLSFDSSTTNALINSFGIIYFLYRKIYLLTLACMATLILTASNFTNLVMLLVLLLIFVFRSSKEQKSIMTVCIFMLVIFLAKFSPQNDSYITENFKNYFLKKEARSHPAVREIPIRERPDSLLNTESRKEKIAVLFLDSLERAHLGIQAAIEKTAVVSLVNEQNIRPQIPGDSIHTPAFQSRKDTTIVQRQLIAYVNTHSNDPVVSAAEVEALPGKIISFIQSIHFFRSHPGKLLTGEGAGNFSSKLAFRATGLKMSGGYPQKFIYCDTDFANNHLALYAAFFTKTEGSHSIIHSPASVYDQVFTEYGLLGIGSFLFFYIGFFLRHIKKLSYGIPVLLIMIAAFTVDYWFEQLSIVVLFELMIFLDIKERAENIVA
ncbi:hypothetical protein BH11BAC4_BH11BAC4_05460 [soil metagenome]